MAQRVMCRVEFFREGDLYVALAPELNVSSFGETLEGARRSIQEAVEAFVEECERMGTLAEVMEEPGFVKKDNGWSPRQPVAAEFLAVG